MAKSETITTRAPNAGKKTPAKKAPHSTKPKSKAQGSTARKATSKKDTGRKATTSKKDSSKKKPTASKKKPRSKTEAEEPYPTWAAPTPAAAVEAVARLASVHGLPSPPERKSILDSLVRTILSQNTSATSVCHSTCGAATPSTTRYLNTGRTRRARSPSRG